MSRARARARSGKAAKIRPARQKTDPAAERAARRERLRASMTTSKPRIAINVALLVVAVLGAALQLLEASRRTPGEHRLWLFVYLLVVVYAGATLATRLKNASARARGADAGTVA